MAKVEYIVHGISCTTGEKMVENAPAHSTLEEATEAMENWMGWWYWYKDSRKLGGNESDFFIEKKVTDYVTTTDEANREQVEWMLKMAASAYACWKGIDEDHPNLGKRGKEQLAKKYETEYRCYLLCLDKFVEGSILDTEAAVKAYSRDEWNI